MQVAREIHQQILSFGADALDRAAGNFNARELRKHALESRDGASGQRRVQRARGAMDRVSLRHFGV